MSGLLLVAVFLRRKGRLLTKALHFEYPWPLRFSADTTHFASLSCPVLRVSKNGEEAKFMR